MRLFFALALALPLSLWASDELVLVNQQISLLEQQYISLMSRAHYQQEQADRLYWRQFTESRSAQWKASLFRKRARLVCCRLLKLRRERRLLLFPGEPPLVFSPLLPGGDALLVP